jgi:hypothetical protein
MVRSSWARVLRVCLALAGAFTVAAVWATAPAVARSPIAEVLCSTRSMMQERLSVQFRAERAAMGMRDADSMMEVWTEPQTGDWTMVVNYASGTSCIVAMGSAWETLQAPPAAESAG